MVGQTISHYKILEKLGSGGMGDVWKAEDTKLGRPVALKLLASHLLRDEEARKRFRREAQAAASLSHPNVTAIHEIDEADGETFLALEYVEGETLEQRIEQGPLPLQDALDIARQIAEGLQAAHAKGIVHRDIKPGNVLITPDGRVKILDFGLALLTERSKLTNLDTTVGTVAYMSPEQTQGSGTDHRTDIWVLGVVLYEMVTGQHPFKGDYDKAVMYSILNEEPEPITALRTGVPMELEVAVSKALAKKHTERYQNTDELVVDLNGLQKRLESGRPRVMATSAQTASIGRHAAPYSKVHWAVAVLPTVALLGLGYVHFSESEPDRAVRRFTVKPQGLLAGGIFPDGKHLFYGTESEGKPVVWVRPISSEFARRLDETHGLVGGFPSPDSRSFVFAADGELKRMSIDGSEVVKLCELPWPASARPFSGGDWDPVTDRIVFSSGFKLYQLPARGGQPELLDETSTLDFAPRFLPAHDGVRAIVYYTTSGQTNTAKVMLFDLESGEQRELAQGASPFYSPPGLLLYNARDGEGFEELWALPFSLDGLRPTGEPFPIAENADEASVSADGTLAYVDDDPVVPQQLVWLDRSGARLGTIGQSQREIGFPALSPDGKGVLFRATDGGEAALWSFELEIGDRTRLTFGPVLVGHAAWNPRGDSIFYTTGRTDNRGDLFRKSADGSGDEELFVKGDGYFVRHPDWSRDGKTLIYTYRGGVYYRERALGGDLGDPVEFLQSGFVDQAPKFSPDGRYLLYANEEFGTRHVFVRTFPDGGGLRQISTESGHQARWSHNGTEIFYVNRDDSTLMRVPVNTANGFSAGPPEKLFQHPGLDAPGGSPTYDVDHTGERFVVIEEVGGERPERSMHIVENWYEEFRDRE